MKYFRCSGSSTLDGLTDVDLSSPTNGQILKYNSTTQKWENADESGGGGGENTRFESTELLSSTISTGGTYTLEDALENYDFVTIVSGTSHESDIRTIAVEDILNTLSDGIIVNLIGAANRWVNITACSGTSITIAMDAPYIHSIKGYKLVGGGGGSKSDIVIVNRTDNTNPYAWLIPCDANGNVLKPSEVTLLSIFAEADMSGAPPYNNGLNVCVDTDSDRYYCKLYNTQTGGYVGDGVYSVDYTVAYIPNSGGSSGGGSSSHTYSTTEQKVGTWIDGSDIYEKSFEVTITQSSNPIIEQDASYIDALISYDAVVKNSLGYISGVGMSASGWGFALHRNPSAQLLLHGNLSEAIGGKAYVTIRYTKVSTS